MTIDVLLALTFLATIGKAATIVSLCLGCECRSDVED